MTIARRPIASIEQVDGLQTALEERDITVAGAGAGALTDGNLVTVGDHAYINREDIGTSLVMGGATNYENVVGGNLANVDTASSNLVGAPTLTGENGNWVVITGGYDNVVNGWACVISGYHNKVGLGANHGTIVGGSKCAIADGVSYATINGGSSNAVDADYGTVGGGIRNVAGGVNATVSGGTDNSASGLHAVVGGGNGNVASGGSSSVGGGFNNDAIGGTSRVGGGQNNTATAPNATVGGGTTNDATAAQSTIGGGDNNDASAQAATVGGGSANIASATYSTVPGGFGNKAAASFSTAIGRQANAARRGGLAHAAGYFAAIGDAQTSVLVARRQTTDETPAIVGLDGTVNERILIPANTSIAFSALVVGRRTDAGGEDSAAYKVEGLIKSDASTVAFVGTPTVTVLGETDTNWDCTVAANNTNKALDLSVTGASGKTVCWVARVTLVEVTG